MACGGCRRKKKSASSRSQSKKTTTKAVLKKVNSDLDNTKIFNRKKKCSKCPFATTPGLSGRCKKGNRVISKIVEDASFKCPIGRF